MKFHILSGSCAFLSHAPSGVCISIGCLGNQGRLWLLLQRFNVSHFAGNPLCVCTHCYFKMGFKGIELLQVPGIPDATEGKDTSPETLNFQ
jgi:hypothetical protein